MHGLVIKRYSIIKTSLSKKLAEDAAEFPYQGKIAVVALAPSKTLASTRKQWLGLIRRMKSEKASTLDSEKKRIIKVKLDWMQQLKFTAKPPMDTLELGISFATADDFVRNPPDCQIIFITYQFEREKLHMLTSWMPPKGQVIIYE
ncbi:MAG TPA: hypothetical protein VD907_06450 [Verrucomicrobiae bacterium]|nr:hypothetical protein [Verrucomicrobiae bacterium]